ncbi:hypothetical protein M8J75_003444 [Diaphorina citri]|nr:hypothetical protein M8J75_003444 [Diaphorina citri]
MFEFCDVQEWKWKTANNAWNEEICNQDEDVDFESNNVQNPNHVISSSCSKADDTDDDISLVKFISLNHDKTLRSVGLKMHVMRKHTGEKPFHCHYCDYICRTKYDLGSHIGRKHTDKEVLEKRYVCQLCPKQFLTSGELKYHQTTVHRKRVHECSECGFTFFLEKTLRAHIRETHRKETPFPCPFCEYKAKRKFELKSHMKRKHTFEDSLTTEETEYYKILES